jgi:hypothetical protein
LFLRLLGRSRCRVLDLLDAAGHALVHIGDVVHVGDVVGARIG